MKQKYKFLIKSSAMGLVIGAVAAAAVYAACGIYLSNFKLTAELWDLAAKMRLTLMVSIALTAALFTISVRLGREERRSELKWRDENRRMAREFSSDIKGVNIAGLIDDSQGKEFSTIFGERMRVGEDHGTMYMVFKMLSVFAFFMTVSITMVLTLMFMSLR